MVMDWIGDFSSQAKVGRAKSPGTPKLWRTPRRWRYSKRNWPRGMRAGKGRISAASRVREWRPLRLWLLVEWEGRTFRFMTLLCSARDIMPATNYTIPEDRQFSDEVKCKCQ